MEVRFEVVKFWDSEQQKYTAEVAIMLPISPIGNLHPLLKSQKLLAGETLGKSWGWRDGKWRVSCVYVSASHITGLEKKVKEEIENMLETLREVAETNREAMRRLEGKEKEVYVYQI